MQLRRAALKFLHLSFEYLLQEIFVGAVSERPNRTSALTDFVLVDASVILESAQRFMQVGSVPQLTDGRANICILLLATI